MRFFFNIQDKLKIQDEVGREFSVASEAVVFAKHLAADMRCLETAVLEGGGDQRLERGDR